jgi:hypothetical protein
MSLVGAAVVSTWCQPTIPTPAPLRQDFLRVPPARWYADCRPVPREARESRSLLAPRRKRAHRSTVQASYSLRYKGVLLVLFPGFLPSILASTASGEVESTNTPTLAVPPPSASCRHPRPPRGPTPNPEAP